MVIKNGLIVEQLPDGGCLIVDDGGRQSHALGAEAGKVWRCLEQNETEVARIAATAGLGTEVVEATLAELEATGLIEVEQGSSRRQWLARAATVAGAAVGLKLIETIATPSPAEAQSLRSPQ